LDRFENPLIRFLGGRGAPITSIAQATGELLLDKDLDPFVEIDSPLDLLKHTGKSGLPFALQGIMEGEGIKAVIAGLAGARTSAETDFEKRDTARDVSRAALLASGDIPESTTGKEFRELGLDIQRQIDENPQVQAAKKVVAELQTRRRRPIQLLTNELDKIDKKQDDLIAGAAEELGEGKAFRVQLAVLQRDRFRDKEGERKQGRHKEALQAIEEFEPSDVAFQKALTAIMEALNDPRLDNKATGEYDHDLREELIGKVRGHHGDGMVDRVERFLRDDSDLRAISPKAADMVKQLREDRETLRPYWDVEDITVAKEDRRIQRTYRGFRKLSEKEQGDMTTHLVGDSSEVAARKELLRRVINAVNKKITDSKEEMRLSDRDIRNALLRQEYTTNPRLRQIQSIEEAIGVR
jgi:hypothetical protein